MKNILSSRTGSHDVLQKLGIKGVEIGPPAPENVDKVKAELSKYGLTCMSVSGLSDVIFPIIAAACLARFGSWNRPNMSPSDIMNPLNLRGFRSIRHDRPFGSDRVFPSPLRDRPFL